MRRALLLFTLALYPGLALAQQDNVSVRALGMGEAVRASAAGAEGPVYNPAGMSTVKQYVVDAAYGFKPEDLGSSLRVSLIDSVTAKVAAGIFYNFIYTTPKSGFSWAGGTVENGNLTRTGHVAGLSLSLPIGDKFAIGATAKYFYISTVAALPKGAVPANLTLDSMRAITFDVGLMLRLAEKFSLGVVGYNLWDHGSREAPIMLGAGLAFNPVAALSINFDAVINFTGNYNITYDDAGKTLKSYNTTVRLGPGLEYVIAEKVPIRAGFVYDSYLPSTYLSLGAGFISQQFGIDLSYRTRLSGGGENYLMLGLRLLVD